MSSTNVPAESGSLTPPPPPTSGYHSTDRNIDDNIMLTIFLCLLCVVVILAILQLYARHVYRRRLAQLRLRQVFVVGSITSPGLNPLTIASLPIFQYPHLSSDDKAPTECTVCLGELESGEMVRLLLNCRHIFHVDCIDTWLGSHDTCPVCRTNVEPAVPPPKEEVVWMRPVGEGETGSKEGCSSSSSVFGSSFTQMLSWERSERRGQIDGVVDLERQ